MRTPEGKVVKNLQKSKIFLRQYKYPKIYFEDKYFFCNSYSFNVILKSFHRNIEIQ